MLDSATAKPGLRGDHPDATSLATLGVPTRFRFGHFDADLATGELLRSGRRVHIQEKPFKILSILLARAGQVVTREELGQQLWPAIHVALDLSLNTAVKKLRAALGDNPRRPHFIETVANRGYRFLRPSLSVVSGSAKPTPHPDAYKAYQRGRHGRAGKWELPKIEEDIAAFEQAIAADENFALAYSGLAAALARLAIVGETRPGEVFPRSRSAALRALELSPELCEPHVVLALVQYAYDNDWSAAEKSCQRALEIDPQFLMAHCGYARLCTARGRHEQAVAALRRAREIAPFSVWAETRLAEGLHFARQYEEALQAARGAVHSDFNFPWAHAILGCVLEQMGEVRAAVGEFQLALRCCPSSAMALAHLGRGFALLGRRADSVRVLDRMKERYRSTYLSPYWIALVHAALGESDEALHWLETAFADRCGWRAVCGVDPRFESLAANPRFETLLVQLHNGGAGHCGLPGSPCPTRTLA